VDISPLVILVSVGAIALFDIVAVWFGADSREPMIDDHLR
jgi:hypothetical protein